MRIVLTSSRAVLAVAAAAGLVLAGAANQAEAQPKGKSIQSEARWVSYDAAGATVTVKVQKPGKRPKLKEASLKKGKEAIFDVKAEGNSAVIYYRNQFRHMFYPERKRRY